MKSYCTDAENWHLHLSMFLTQKQCVVETEEMCVVETEHMSAVEMNSAIKVWIVDSFGSFLMEAEEALLRWGSGRARYSV